MLVLSFFAVIYNVFISDYGIEAGFEHTLSAEIIASQHVLVCALQELGQLVQQIGTSVTSLFIEASGMSHFLLTILIVEFSDTNISLIVVS